MAVQNVPTKQLATCKNYATSLVWILAPWHATAWESSSRYPWYFVSCSVRKPGKQDVMPAALGMQPLGNHQRWMQDAKVLLQIMYRINSVGIISRI